MTDALKGELPIGYPLLSHFKQKRAIKALIMKSTRTAVVPLKFDDLNGKEICVFIRELNVKKSRINSAVAAIKFLLDKHGCKLSTDANNLVTRVVKGMKRSIKSAQAKGALPQDSGAKDALPFDLYSELCLELARSGKSETTFCWLFSVKCWNLMCRSHNTIQLTLNHLSWAGDSLLVYFTLMKNDQLGERCKDPKHLYANPILPQICPVLSLGVYFLTYAFNPSNSMQLFEGSDQYERFRKYIAKFYRSNV